MKVLKKGLVALCILAIVNIVLIISLTKITGISLIVLLLISGLFYFFYSIFPGRISGHVNKSAEIRMQGLYGGCELILTAGAAFSGEVILYVIMLFRVSLRVMLLNAAAAVALLFLLALQGVLRLLVFSRQVKLVTKVLLFFTWWIPLVNLYFIVKARQQARMEYEVEVHLQEMNQARRENSICQTRYPILMVHGVFFRDWHYFNYWGRVPRELLRNGAQVFYGSQQSALSVKASAEELRDQIMEIIHETKCEKVNIIAHSKGGLDARYAISILGMDAYVASLTTIGTPHYGCAWVDKLLQRLPVGLLNWVSVKYNRLFCKLGDREPDFYSAVYNLTREYAECFNAEVKNKEDVLYQSVMSQMDSARSAPFPLNISYHIIKRQQGPNDGLVPVDAAKWGNYLGLVTVPGRRGISHGDMIDLNRENIRDFDIREFYIDLIKGLKNKGL